MSFLFSYHLMSGLKIVSFLELGYSHKEAIVCLLIVAAQSQKTISAILATKYQLTKGELAVKISDN